jgi:hypothetical protein
LVNFYLLGCIGTNLINLSRDRKNTCISLLFISPRSRIDARGLVLWPIEYDGLVKKNTVSAYALTVCIWWWSIAVWQTLIP